MTWRPANREGDNVFNQFQRAAGRRTPLCAGLLAAALIALAPAEAEDYPVDIDIVTADTVGAGTDAVPISLTISYINTNGEENGYLLRIDEDVDPQTGENRFERGRTDSFRVDLPTEVDHFTQIELTTNIANLDHVSETFTMAAWEVESVTLTPVRNRRLSDGEILAITPTVIHINRRVDAQIPTIIAYPDDHPVAEAEPAPESGPEPVDEPELQPDPITDNPTGGSTADANNARCRELVQGHVAWDQNPRNTTWNPENLERLCSSGQDADLVVACFKAELAANGYQWRPAVETCRADASSGGAVPPQPMPAPGAAPVDDLTQRCKAAVQDKVVWDLNHPNDPVYRHWNEDNLDRLCRSRAEPPETIACFTENLGSNGNQWSPAIDTCSRLRPR